MKKNFEINNEKINIKCNLYYNDLNNIFKIVLCNHGFGGSKDNNYTSKTAECLLSKYNDLALISFDWPCHGNDVRQKLDLKDCNDYLECVIGCIRNNFNVNTICSYATSFGGYLILKYISEHENPFSKIVLRCPAVNMYDVVVDKIVSEEQMDELKKGKTIQVSQGQGRKIKITPDFMKDLQENDVRKADYIDVADNMIIIQGTDDELISYNEVKLFSENNVIDFISVEKADHRFKNPAKLKESINYIDDFFKSVLTQENHGMKK